MYKERDENKRQDFLAEINALDPDKVIYVDESGIDHAQHRLYARWPRNARIYSEISGKYLSRTTLIAGYVPGGFLAPFRFKGHTNTAVFNQWVETCLVPSLIPGQVIVMDNASFHKSKRTVELIEAAGCRVLFQPAYSPDLNKIEPMWANLKHRLKSYQNTTKTFLENLDHHFCHMCKC